VLTEGAPRAHVLVIHGYAEHCRRYGFLTDDLSARGFECWTFDHRGHGDSDGPRGYVKDFSHYLADLDSVLAYVQSHPERSQAPTILVGHSMGGLVLARWLQTRNFEDVGLDVRGAFFSSPFFALKLAVPPIKRLIANLLALPLPRFALTNELEADHLTRDEGVQLTWARDTRMVRKVPVRWFTEALKAQELAFQCAARVRIATAIHHGAADGVADPNASERFHDAMTFEQRELKLWPELRHEIFNEIERAEVFAALAKWIEARLEGEG
jgi:lysophospholipase